MFGAGTRVLKRAWTSLAGGCNYSAAALVPSGQLTAKEATAIDKIWAGSHNTDGTQSWYGIPRGASFGALANAELMSIAYGQAKYWVEFDPAWDYHALTYDNYAAFYAKTCRAMTPGPVLFPLVPVGTLLYGWKGY